jgi:hypothetical protein
MGWLPSFVAWPFAVAGLLAAAGPVIIHLLNRRRFRVVQWAAMDFLRQALERNRRILQMRDLLLLLLRTVAVLLVGLALAQPFFSRSQEVYDGTKPLHCVLVIDNSLSMGYESLDGTLLDQAKQRARQLIERLPADSRVSIIPLCGSRWGAGPDAFPKDDALIALQQIEIVDRPASVQRAVNEARRACETGPSLAKRVMFFSDQQASNWAGLSISQMADLPSLQVIEIGDRERENTWISDFRLQDGVADTETPAIFQVELRHQGNGPRENLQVTLAVDDVEVASKTVTLEPGSGAREVAFSHTFQGYQPESGRTVSVPVRVSIAPDRLSGDDQRHLVVPVVSSLPVVFVDQYGAGGEDVRKNRLGETRPLRRLLAPVTSRGAADHQSLRLRHVTSQQLDRSQLEDARLVVIAGLTDPGASVPLLREYVQQGGQLLIAAGGRYDPRSNSGFDPALWTSQAWLDGAGILPAPLLPETLGALPDQAGDSLRPFSLAFDSLASSRYFPLAGLGEDELRGLYAEPFFFQAARTDLSAEMFEVLSQQQMRQWNEELDLIALIGGNRSGGSSRGEPAVDEARLVQARERLLQLRPTWLLWGDARSPLDALETDGDPARRQRQIADLIARTHPRVLARFDDPADTAFAIERNIGNGTVIFVSSGLLPEWNTLATTNAMLIFDRILRGMIRATLPLRNFSTVDRITLPLPTPDRDIRAVLQRPGEASAAETLDVGFVGREQLGLSVEQPLTRGVYRITALRGQADVRGAAPETVWQIPLAVNGDAGESDLQCLTREQFEQRIALANVQWIGAGEPISLAGSQIRGQNSWWWLVLAVLLLLLLELVVLGSHWGTSRRVPTAAVT